MGRGEDRGLSFWRGDSQGVQVEESSAALGL